MATEPYSETAWTVAKIRDKRTFAFDYLYDEDGWQRAVVAYHEKKEAEEYIEKMKTLGLSGKNMEMKPVRVRITEVRDGD